MTSTQDFIKCFYCGCQHDPDDPDLGFACPHDPHAWDGGVDQEELPETCGFRESSA